VRACHFNLTPFSLTMPITGQITGYVDAQGAFSEDSTTVMVSLGGRATWQVARHLS
jgi:hypothetical protein